MLFYFLVRLAFWEVIRCVCCMDMACLISVFIFNPFACYKMCAHVKTVTSAVVNERKGYMHKTYTADNPVFPYSQFFIIFGRIVDQVLNSFDPGEMPSYLASHPDPICVYMAL